MKGVQRTVLSFEKPPHSLNSTTSSQHHCERSINVRSSRYLSYVTIVVVDEDMKSKSNAEM